jgi:hypothetical protein
VTHVKPPDPGSWTALWAEGRAIASQPRPPLRRRALAAGVATHGAPLLAVSAGLLAWATFGRLSPAVTLGLDAAALVTAGVGLGFLVQAYATSELPYDDAPMNRTET